MIKIQFYFFILIPAKALSIPVEKVPPNISFSIGVGKAL